MHVRTFLKAALVAAFVLPLFGGTTPVSAQVNAQAPCGFVGSDDEPEGGGGNPSCAGFTPFSEYPLWKEQETHMFIFGDGTLHGGGDPLGIHWRPSATKVVNISVNVWLDDNGQNNYYDDPEGLNRARFVELFDWISENYFETVAAPTDPAVEDPSYYLTDSWIRLNVG